MHDDYLVLLRELNDLFEELRRCSCTGRVVRVVDVQELYALQVIRGKSVEVWQKAVLFLQREIYDPSAVPLGMSCHNGITGHCHKNAVAGVYERFRYHGQRGRGGEWMGLFPFPGVVAGARRLFS